MKAEKALYNNKVVFIFVWVLVFLSVVLLVFVICFSPSYSYTRQVPRAEKGILDLTSWSFEKDGAVKLNGEWEFYWGQLLTPEDFAKKQSEEKAEMKDIWAIVPKSWNKYKLNGKTLSADGCATFRLKVKLKDTDNINVLGIKLATICTSYKLWINGNIRNSIGKVGKKKEEFSPGYFPDTVYFNWQNQNETGEADGINEIEIIIQVANFIHRRGGIWQPLILGTENQIKSLNERRLFSDIFIFSCLFIIGLYQIFMYFTSPKRLYMFYLGVFSLILSIRTLLLGEMYLVKLFPAVPQEIFLKIEYITLCLGLIYSTLYLESIFPGKLSKEICLIFKLSGIAYSVFVVFIPTRVLTRFVIVIQLTVIMAGLYFISAIKPVLKERKEKVFILAGTLLSLLFYGTIVNDILYFNEIISTGSYSSFGFFIFVLAHFLMISVRHTMAFSRAESASQHLAAINRLKDDFVIHASYQGDLYSSTLELNEVLDRLLIRLKSFVLFDCGVVMLKEDGEETDSLWEVGFRVVLRMGCFNANCSHRGKGGKTLIIPKDNPLIKTVLEKQRPVIIRDANNVSYCICENVECDKRSFLAVPIVNSGEVLGIIVLQKKEKNAFTEYDAEILYNFAAHSGIAIKNAKLFTEVKNLARIDDLTKLSNRRYFFELAEREFKLHKRYKNLQTLSMIMMDIDDFKKINDTYGHYLGDNVLRAVAEKCKKSLRETDIIGRYGGEEYTILLPHTGSEEAKSVAERLLSSIAECPIIFDDNEISVTVSIGVAVMDDSINTMQELLQKADTALYAAKKKGKNCIVLL
ncbi:MAG: diguanylate cyclase [Firmicutes bacterium]|nr:diguanylate cyclase [Bacillota bacterium]